jgi:hypothetical protein
VRGVDLRGELKTDVVRLDVVVGRRETKLDLGGTYNVFPTREHAERFVGQVSERREDRTVPADAPDDPSGALDDTSERFAG